MLKAIETKYKGYKFRSRLEARWACFFDALGIEWEYEKEGYELPSGWYLPDFMLHGVGLRGSSGDLWCEIKPVYTDEASNKLSELVIASGIDGLLLCDRQIENDCCGEKYELPYNEQFNPHTQKIEAGCGWDNCMSFQKCLNKKCGRITTHFAEGSYLYCPNCGNRTSEDHPQIIKAVEAARSARFEHGEQG